MTRPSFDARLWSLIDRRGPEECWPFKGSLTQTGYGRMSLPRPGKRTIAAHRAAYESAIGPVPEELVLDHLCRNRACCNPAHLEPVTDRVNVLRGISPIAVNASKTHCDHGHPLTEPNTQVNPQGHRRCRTCTREQRNAVRAKRRSEGAELPPDRHGLTGYTDYMCRCAVCRRAHADREHRRVLAIRGEVA